MNEDEAIEIRTKLQFEMTETLLAGESLSPGQESILRWMLDHPMSEDLQGETA